jgi:hypothetical protein
MKNYIANENSGISTSGMDSLFMWPGWMDAHEYCSAAGAEPVHSFD